MLTEFNSEMRRLQFPPVHSNALLLGSVGHLVFSHLCHHSPPHNAEILMNSANNPDGNLIDLGPTAPLGHRISQYDHRQICELVEKKRDPDYMITGRTPILELRDPISVDGSTQFQIKCIKLKGARFMNEQGTISGPTITPYSRNHWHLSFSKNGEFENVDSPLCPEGGMLRERALKEFVNACTLSSTPCDCQIPLLVGKVPVPHHFVERWRDEYAFVALGCLNSRGRRLNETLDELIENEENTLPELLSLTYKRIGRNLRFFHSHAQLFRYSGNLDNFDASDDFTTIALADLDSSLSIYSENTTDCNRGLFLIRDIASTVYGLTTYLATVSSNRNAPSLFTASLRSALISLFSEYFEVDGSTAESTSASLVKTLATIVVEHWATRPPPNARKFNSTYQEERWQHRMSNIYRATMYTELMLVCSTLYNKSSVGRSYPLLYSHGQILAFSRAFMSTIDL